MSRSKKTRSRRRHGSHLQYPKMQGNRRVRHNVTERLKDVLFTDAFDEKGLPERKQELFNMWWYD